MSHDQGYTAHIPSRSLIVNGSKIPIWRHIMNPMIQETCRKHGVDYMDNHIIHTHIHELHLPFVRPLTTSLIYYFPDRIDPAEPLIAIAGLRLNNPLPNRTIADAIHYEKDSCQIIYTFILPGDLGGIATVNLGFLLLNELTGVMPSGITILTLADMAYLQKNMDNMPVADEAIERFCAQRGIVRI